MACSRRHQRCRTIYGEIYLIHIRRLSKADSSKQAYMNAVGGRDDMPPHGPAARIDARIVPNFGRVRADATATASSADPVLNPDDMPGELWHAGGELSAILHVADLHGVAPDAWPGFRRGHAMYSRLQQQR